MEEVEDGDGNGDGDVSLQRLSGRGPEKPCGWIYPTQRNNDNGI